MKDILIRTDRFILKSLIKEDVNERYLDWINGPNRSEYIVNENQERSIDDLCSYVEGKLLDEYVLFLGIFASVVFAKHLGSSTFCDNSFVLSINLLSLERMSVLSGLLIFILLRIFIISRLLIDNISSNISNDSRLYSFFGFFCA